MNEYKVGDEVVIRNDLIIGEWYDGNTFINNMCDCLGRIVTIRDIESRSFIIKESLWNFTFQMIDHEATKSLHNKKDITVDDIKVGDKIKIKSREELENIRTNLDLTSGHMDYAGETVVIREIDIYDSDFIRISVTSTNITMVQLEMIEKVIPSEEKESAYDDKAERVLQYFKDSRQLTSWGEDGSKFQVITFYYDTIKSKWEVKVLYKSGKSYYSTKTSEKILETLVYDEGILKEEKEDSALDIQRNKKKKMLIEGVEIRHVGGGVIIYKKHYREDGVLHVEFTQGGVRDYNIYDSLNEFLDDIAYIMIPREIKEKIVDNITPEYVIKQSSTINYKEELQQIDYEYKPKEGLYKKYEY